MNLRRGWFTLVEIITVVVILWTLSTALYMGVQPYLKRSRDTHRVTDVINYITIIDAYDKNFDTYPSNYWSWSSTGTGYCLSEMYLRPNYAGYSDMKFQSLWSGTTAPPRDPIGSHAISPCTMSGSYLYSRLDFGVSSQMAIIAAKLEIKESANFWTGSDLLLTGSVDAIKLAKKWSVKMSAPDSLFVVSRFK